MERIVGMGRGPRLFGIVVGMAFALTLAGCGHSVQTTSGADYLAKTPTIATYPSGAQQRGTPSIDATVRQVAAVEPILRFPARIGLARVQRGELSPIPEAEAKAWYRLADKLGPDFGTFVPINRLIAEMVASSVVKKPDADHVRSVMEKIRLGAARQHVDVVLVYEVYGTSNSKTNPLAIADWTIIGAFLLPSRSVEATGYATALLVDVRNGYPYGTADTVVSRDGLATAFGSSDRQRDLDQAAGTEAAIALTGEVETMMAKLAARLTATAARSTN